MNHLPVNPPNDTQNAAQRPLARRSRAAVWHPCTQMHSLDRVPPLPIARAQGAWLYDDQGQAYADLISSWWVNLFGHADAGISEAISRQLQTLPHVMLAGCTHEPAVALAERLAQTTGGALGHCFFASDGASAVEIALKLSVHYWRNRGHSGKDRFVCLQGSYHGETLGALGVTDVPVFREAYGPLLRPALVAPSPDARHAQPGESARDVALRAAQGLAELLEAHRGEIAALILEPMVQCAGGMAMYDAEYLRQARALCDAHEVHLIADEIAVGCGRTGHIWAWQHSHEGHHKGYHEDEGDEPDRWPDFLCVSKGITGGFLPLSLVLCTDTVYQGFWHEEVARGFLHSHSYTGNALACAAALAVLDRLQSGAMRALWPQQAQWLEMLMQPALTDPRWAAHVRHPRQIGTIAAFDLDAAVLPARFAERLHLAGRRHGLLLRPIGGTVYAMPPLVLSEDLARFAGQGLVNCLAEVLGDTPASSGGPAAGQSAVC
ncbi:adenosylmethionine--8-amino-7-oxononanoate transaminase [Amphibiibacter pelophylacis]|uniref:Adenosylmethionine--8-amino-7-oxononanoate transaminase n=1 Tax=Amphibiibacter pelophylacis TaxID=1799477 RepID=A0ACC6P0R1_9BURK